MNKIRVRKRGSTFYFSFEAGRKPDGSRRTIEKGGFPDQQAAYDAGVAAYTDWCHGSIGIVTERISVADYLKSYLTVRSPELRRGSLQTYRVYIKKINRYIGHVILQDLRPRDIDTMFRKMVAEGSAKRTVSTAKTILKSALDYAIYPAEIISSNPVAAIKVPRNAKETVVKRTVIDMDTYSDILRQWPVGSWFNMWAKIAYHTGMRVSEICGLTWDDVDLDRGLIRISRQMVTAIGYVGFGPTKTPTSEREIYIDSKLVNDMKLWQREQLKQRISAGHKYMLVFMNSDDSSFSMETRNTCRQNPINFVLTHPSGKFCTSSQVDGNLRPLGLNSHSFRHTHTTLLAEDATVTPKALAARLGHKDATITQNVYTHVTDKMREDVCNSFQKIVDKIL